MIKTMKRKTIHLFGACALLLASCTNLDPDIYSDMTIDKILEDSEQSSAYLLTPMYGQMRWFNEDPRHLGPDRARNRCMGHSDQFGRRLV